MIGRQVRCIRSGTGGVPVWVLVVGGLVILGGCVFVALIFATGSLLQGFGKQVVDPAAAAKVAQEIMEMKEPLPKGWDYTAGVNMGPMKMALIRNQKSQAVVNFTRYPKSSHPDEIAEGAAKGAHMTIEERGEDKIGGRKVTFVRGSSSTKGQHLAMELDTVAADNGDLIMIHSMEPERDKFDRSLVQPVFDSVIRFK
jgi:hypothetical protein